MGIQNNDFEKRAISEIIRTFIGQMLGAFCVWLAVVGIFEHGKPWYIGLCFAAAYLQLLPRSK